MDERNMKPAQREMLKALMGQSPDAAENFVREHTSWMLPLARRILGKAELAELAVQNTFSSIFKNAIQLKEVNDIKHFMRRRTIEEAVILMPVADEEGEQEIDALMPEFDKNGCRFEDHWSKFRNPEEILKDAPARQKILDEIEKLPDRYRVVILLRDVEELTISEVATVLNLSEGDAKVRLNKARAALKKKLEPLLRGGAL